MVLRDAGNYHHAYHLAAWKQVHRQAYGTEPLYLGVRDGDGQLAAGLPLWIRGGGLRAIQAALQTKDGVGPPRAARLVSVFRGGPLGSDLDARAEVLAAACRLVDERGLQNLTMITGVRGCEELIPGLRVKPFDPAWVTMLPSDPEELRSQWRKRSRNLYRSVTKAEQRGAVVRPVRSRGDLWSFYRQHVQNMRRLRAVPRSWLEIRLAHRLLAPAGRCRVWLVEYCGEVVAGAMFLALGGVLEPFYIGSDRRADDVRPAHAVYWHAIKWAIASGLTRVFWGNAPADTSLGSFKRQWSAEPVDHFEYVYAPARSAPRVEPPAAGAPPLQPSGLPPSSSHQKLVTQILDHIPADALRLAATIGHRLG